MNDELGTGRNFVKREFQNGNYILIKKLNGEGEDQERRFENLIIWDKIIKDSNFLHSPKILNYENEGKKIFYEYIEHDKTLQDELSNNLENIQFSLIDNAVDIIAQLHKINYKKFDLQFFRQDTFLKKYLHMFNCFSISEFCNSTGAELELFALLQNDQELCKHIRQLEKKYEIKDVSLCHGDMRLDQFIIDNNKNVWLIDFEELKLGDVREDLGNFIGAILFDCFIKIFSNPKLENSDSINQGIQELGSFYLPIAKDLINQVVIRYNSQTDNSLSISDLGYYIGFYIFERIISRAKFSVRLTAVDKAILGIGREMIVEHNALQEFIR